jgi:hypothetical protein
VLVDVERCNGNENDHNPPNVDVHDLPPYMRLRRLSIMAAASPPLTNSAATSTTPATANLAFGGSANITTANTTSATSTPVSRTGLFAEAAIAVLRSKVGTKEHDECAEEVRKVNSEDVEVFHLLR